MCDSTYGSQMDAACKSKFHVAVSFKFSVNIHVECPVLGKYCPVFGIACPCFKGARKVGFHCTGTVQLHNTIMTCKRAVDCSFIVNGHLLLASFGRR